MKILVVDDEPDVSWLFRQRFRREIKAGKVRFTFAHSGDEALAYLRAGGAAHVVLVLTDINMPGMTGLEMLRTIKAEFAGLPVHVITAYGDEHNYRAALDGGADGYFTKPLDFGSLKRELVGV